MKLNKIQYKFNNVNFYVYLRDDVDLSVFNEMFKYREYRSCEDILRYSDKGIVLDIGAHIGLFSLYAYCLNKNVEIYSIEPEKHNLEILGLNKKENKIKNIKIIDCAITERKGDGELVVTDDSINNYVLSSEDFEGSKLKFQKIKLLTLEDFLKENKIEKVLLLKMDIEGGEYKVFESIKYETLSKINNIILEYHLDKDIGYDQKFLENILRINGFSVQFFPSGFDPKMGFILARNKR